MLIFQLATRYFSKRMVPNCAGVAALIVLAMVQSVQAEEADKTSATPVSASAANAQAASAVLQKADSGKQPGGVDIDQSIVRLGSSDFRTREEAVRQLVAAGRPAIEPLTKAARGDDLEISYRAVRVLQTLLQQDDQATEDEAADALQKLASDPSKPAADLATDALTVYHLTLQDKALATLRNLGATVTSDQLNLEPGDLQVTLDDHWKGKKSDLRLLKDVPNLAWLRVINRSLDDDELSTIAGLSQATEIDLFGTGISADAAQKLATALPDAVVDRRNGAFLGVGGLPGMTSCLISEVREDSAAAAAGIQVGDEITTFDGQPVHNFEEFTSLVSNKKGGDQIDLQVRRDNEVLTKKVRLGQWQSDLPVIFHGNSRPRNVQTPLPNAGGNR
ncbi:MAG TPA: PDZ domain-containing protein [Pirellulales bacterium]|nr:PDZ domain-containing protein [Pirellulales bacterium]